MEPPSPARTLNRATQRHAMNLSEATKAAAAATVAATRAAAAAVARTATDNRRRLWQRRKQFTHTKTRHTLG